MLVIRKMKLEDEPVAMPLIKAFYQSDAVCHPVSETVLRNTFLEGAKDSDILQGLMLEDETGVVGYAYISSYFSCEVGGICVMLEELFFVESSRGKGYGKQYFAWVRETYPSAKRLRLEVTSVNGGAIRLYKQLGFSDLEYNQMISDAE